MTDHENRWERLHRFSVAAFALLLGLFEGPAQVALLATLATTVATGRLRGWRPGRLEAAALVWFAVGYVGLLETETPRTSAGALAPLHVLGLLVGARAFRGLDLARPAALFVGALVLNAGWGILQVVWQDPVVPGLASARARAAVLRDPEHPERFRLAAGLFYNRLRLAHVGIVGLATALVAAASAPRWRKWAGLAATVIAVGLLLSARRAAPIALLVAGWALLWLRGQRRAALGLLAAGGIVLAGAAATDLGAARLAGLAEDARARATMYGWAAQAWSEAPLVGVGHGDYKGALLDAFETNDVGANLHLTSAHNQYLQAFAETGLLGGLAFLGLSLLAMWRAQSGLRSEDTPWRRAGFLAVVTLGLLGLAHTTLYHASVAMVFWVAVGAVSEPRR